MFKGNTEFVISTLREKRDNLLKYRNIYSFTDHKLDKETSEKYIRDIDDFISEIKNMKDFYVDVNNSADKPENFTGVDVKYIRILDHVSDNISVYWVMIAIEATQIEDVDKNNHVLYRKGNELFYVENKFYGTKKGYIRIKPATFRDE